MYNMFIIRYLLKHFSFTWDPKKAKTNFTKHGITFETAIKIFRDENIIYKKDVNHSYETRYIFIGATNNNILFVVAAIRKYKTIRIISARLANIKERKSYERNKVQRYWYNS